MAEALPRSGLLEPGAAPDAKKPAPVSFGVLLLREIMEYKNAKIYKMEFLDAPFIQEFKFTQSRTSSNKYLQIIIIGDNKATKIIFKNPYPYDNSFDIIDAVKIWIESESQKEYAKFKVSYYSNGSYTECWSDSVKFL